MKNSRAKALCHRCGREITGNVDPTRLITCHICLLGTMKYIDRIEKESGVKVVNKETYKKAKLLAAGYTKEHLILTRQNKGWSQRQLAAYLDVQKQFIQQMEDGDRPLILNALEFISENFIENGTEGPC